MRVCAHTHTHMYTNIHVTSLSIHPLMDHKVCFHVLFITKNAAAHKEMCISFQVSVLFSFDKYPGVEQLDHGISVFNFLRTSVLFSIVVAPIYIPTSSDEESLFSTPLPILVIPCVFGCSHPDRCEMMTHWVLIRVSLVISDTGLHSLLGILLSLLGTLYLEYYLVYLECL